MDLFGEDPLRWGRRLECPTALAMTYAGAAGETADQMTSTLHFGLPGDMLHTAFNAYALDLEARAKAGRRHAL